MKLDRHLLSKLFFIMIFPLGIIAQYAAPASASIGSGSLNTSVGESAGNDQSSGDYNSFFGTYSGENMTTGNSNSFFGSESGYFNSTGNSNSFFGFNAGFSNFSGSSNSYYGVFSGSQNKSGDQNAFFGFASGESNVGSNNSFFGSKSGQSNKTGYSNTFVGKESGYLNMDGYSNSFFGDRAGISNLDGSKNSFFGEVAGGNNWSGDENTFIGYSSGILIGGDRNICLGSNAGPLPGGGEDERLYIDVVQSNDPLIYGEFDNDFVKINGTFEVTAGLSNPSDVNLKSNFSTIEASEILEKVITIPIQKWTYKNRPAEVHIGATAQDFYSAFGLGSGDKTISTIDADGVALASIQALKKENQDLKETIMQLIKRIELLEEKN